MKTLIRWCLVLELAGGLAGISVLADEMSTTNNTVPVNRQPALGILDNLYLNAGAGIEEPPGEDSTFFGTVGADWALPLTPPDGVALGLQAGGNVKARDDDPEFNATSG